MKVLLTVERFTPQFGGAERYAVDLARGLASSGVSVQVAAQSYDEVPPGVEVIPIRPVPWPKGLRVYDFGKRTARLQPEYDVVHGLVKTWGVDVFHPHTGSHRASLHALRESRGSEAARWAAGLTHLLSPKQAVFRWIESQQYSPAHVKVFVAVSRMVAEDMVRLHGVARDDIRVLYNPVDATRFHPGDDGDRETIRKRHGIETDGFLALFAAHHFRLKGLDVLLRALGRLGEEAPRLLVLGRGRPAPYRKLAHALGVADHVVFAGERGDPEAYYRGADVFLHPTFYDPCSLTVLEAMASGLPVVTSTRNGASELMAHGKEGFILEDPARDDRLASLIRELTDVGLRREMGRRARERAETLDPQAHLDAILTIYEDVAKVKGRPGGP
ncbi:MAG: glycosyltransferase family 4 protein [Planctomycetota bacterium]